MLEYNFVVFNGDQSLTNEMALTLSELDQLYFPTPWDFESWNNLFIDHDRLLVVLQLGKKCIGFCLFNTSVADSFGHLLKILIHPQFRNSGQASELLKMALVHLGKIGCSQYFLEVEETNYPAVKLYKSVGFQVIHCKKKFYGSNRSALIMTKS